MKIIHVMTSFALGGAERVVCDLASGQVARGHDVIIVGLRRTPQGQEEFAAVMLTDLHEKGIRTIDLRGRNFRDEIPYMIFALWRTVRRMKPDIVHAHVDQADFIVSMVGRLTRMNIVRTIHNTVLWPTHYVFGWLAEHALHDDDVAAVSVGAMAAYEKMRARFGLKPTERRRVIYNGVPLPPILQRSPPGEYLKLAYFGRNNAQKGLDTLCRALNFVAQKARTKVQVDLYTDAKREDIAVTATSTLTLNLYPPTPQARAIMANYDVLAVPSRYEGLPLVPLEAMAASVPVIVTDAPGLREVTPPGWPLVVPIDDASELADRIDEIGSGKHDLVALGRRARVFAEVFGLDAQVEAYQAVYNEIVLNKGRLTR